MTKNKRCGGRAADGLCVMADVDKTGRSGNTFATAQRSTTQHKYRIRMRYAKIYTVLSSVLFCCLCWIFVAEARDSLVCACVCMCVRACVVSTGRAVDSQPVSWSRDTRLS